MAKLYFKYGYIFLLITFYFSTVIKIDKELEYLLKYLRG